MTLLNEDIHYIIKHKLKLEDFKLISFDDSNLEKNPIGFLSDQIKKCIKYKNQGKVEELFLFIKQMPKSEYQRKNLIQMGCFQRESLVFEEILADFQDNSIPIPKHYLTKSDGTIVLEDLTVRGFQNKDSHETLDLAHCEAVLKSLAKFHAASFIMERRKKFKINEKYPILETEGLLSGDVNHPGNKCFMAGIRSLKKITEKYLSYYRTEVTEKAFNYMEGVCNKFGTSEIYPNALSHSDMWSNNIMYKYDGSGILEQAFLVDFQVTTYKPPAFDVLFFLHLCTEKELRRNYYSHMSKLYFNTLSEQLALSGINMDTIMSWSEYEEMQKDALPVVLGKTPFYLSFVLMPSNIINDVLETDEKFQPYWEEDRTEFVLQAMEANKHYNQRNLECLTELFDYFMTH